MTDWTAKVNVIPARRFRKKSQVLGKEKSEEQKKSRLCHHDSSYAEITMENFESQDNLLDHEINNKQMYFGS